MTQSSEQASVHQRHWNAVDYHAHSSAQYEQAMRLITQYAFRGDEAVLDVGCGDGRVTYQIALRVPNGSVLGLDQSDAMVRYARAHYAQLDKLAFVCGDEREQFVEAVVHTYLFKLSSDRTVFSFKIPFVNAQLRRG